MPNKVASKARAIRASDGLWDAVDARAVADGVSVSDVVRAALIAYLDVDPAEVKPVTGRPDRRVRGQRSADDE